MATPQGLVEISAISTIVGAPTAEALTHGLKAACGIAWSPTSCFGAIHITKACLAASVPDGLRDAMGLRNEFVDTAIGVILRVNQFKQARNRVDLGNACAILVAANHGAQIWVDRATVAVETSLGTSHVHNRTLKTQLMGHFLYRGRERLRRRAGGVCIYTLDRNSQLVMDTVPAAVQGEPVKIHRFMPDIDGTTPPWKDWVVLLASLAKLGEVFCLRASGSAGLWYWTMVGWSHGFLTAVILQLIGLGRDNALRSTNDIIGRTLPTPLHLGDSGKVVLDVPTNVRRHRLRRCLLGLGAFCNAAGVFGIFAFLGTESSRVIYVWIAFQILWLFCRTVVFYCVEGAAARQVLIINTTWEDANERDRDRVMILLTELAKHQVSIFPRRVRAYAHDCLSFHQITICFNQSNWTLTQYFPGEYFDGQKATNGLSIRAVAGDPLIRSVVWFTKAQLTSSELYDSAIAFVHIDGKILAVPCVRVYACACLPDGGHMRGNSHVKCNTIEWLYFIPLTTAGVNQWVYAHGLCGVGLLAHELLTDNELHARLAKGMWHISLTSLTELRTALTVSQDAAALVMALVQTASARPEKVQKIDDELSKASTKNAEIWKEIQVIDD